MYPIRTWPPGRVSGGVVQVCVLSWQKGEHAIKNCMLPIFERKYFVRTRDAVYSLRSPGCHFPNGP